MFEVDIATKTIKYAPNAGNNLFMARAPKRKLKVMVSSTVYGDEDLLNQIYAILSGFGFEVWMSHKGTVPQWPGLHPFDACLKAVEDCDIFFGIIRPFYGTGKIKPKDTAITHQELIRAIALEKPRWLIAHDIVINARRILIDVGFDSTTRSKLTLKKGAKLIDDLGVIDMYEAAIQDAVAMKKRVDSLVQAYRTRDDVLLYVTSQFDRHDELAEFLAERSAKKTKQTRKKGATP